MSERTAKGSPKLRQVSRRPARASAYKSRLLTRAQPRPSGAFPFLPDTAPAATRRPSRVQRSVRLSEARQAKALRLLSGSSPA